jgi:hypothetical protein
MSELLLLTILLAVMAVCVLLISFLVAIVIVGSGLLAIEWIYQKLTGIGRPYDN